jgi:toxin ParE1/3/4
MAAVHFAEAAIVDLDDIWSFIARTSPTSADRFVERLEETFMLLAEQPGMGRPRDDLQPGLRSFPVQRYLILYSKTEDGVLIRRVLSTYRDIEGMFRGT